MSTICRSCLESIALPHRSCPCCGADPLDDPDDDLDDDEPQPDADSSDFDDDDVDDPEAALCCSCGAAGHLRPWAHAWICTGCLEEMDQ